jgi:hypothetical protein
MPNINPTLASTPSGADYTAKRTAFESAVTAHGAQSVEARKAGAAAMQAAQKCAKELGAVIPD